MNFLKSIIEKLILFFKSKSKDKSWDSELIEAFKLFFVDKDIGVLVARIIELLGSPISWANSINLGRLNYIIYIASKGKMLTLEDFMEENNKIIPTHIRIAFGLFK